MRNLFILSSLLLLFISPSWADNSFGGIANSLMDPISGTISLVDFICGITGGAMVIASIIKLIEYFQNRTQMSLLTILTLFLAGLALFSLIFIPIYLSN